MVINNSQHSSQFPWMDIITFFNNIPIEQRKSYGRHSKGNAKDFGYHNWNNSTRDGNPLGIARPGMIPGSNEPIPKLCSTSLSELEGAHQISVIGILL